MCGWDWQSRYIDHILWPWNEQKNQPLFKFSWKILYSFPLSTGRTILLMNLGLRFLPQLHSGGVWSQGSKSHGMPPHMNPKVMVLNCGGRQRHTGEYAKSTQKGPLQKSGLLHKIYRKSGKYESSIQLYWGSYSKWKLILK